MGCARAADASGCTRLPVRARTLSRWTAIARRPRRQPPASPAGDPSRRNPRRPFAARPPRRVRRAAGRPPPPARPPLRRRRPAAPTPRRRPSRRAEDAAQTPLGPGAGRSACWSHCCWPVPASLGGAVWFDTRCTARRCCTITPTGPAAGRGTNWLLVGSDSRQGLTAEQQHDAGHRRRHRQWPHRHHPAGTSAGVRVQHPADDGVDTARFVRLDPRAWQGQDQRRVRDRRGSLADPDGGAGHRSAPRPLRRDRIRWVRRPGRRAGRSHRLPDRADQRSVGRHRPAAPAASS